MRRIHFNNTELMVSPLCLGTVNYGSTLSDEESMRQMSDFLELGGNFIDTARIYGAWANRGDALSERIIGRWLKETGNRDKIILATKGAHPHWDSMHIMRVHPEDIEYDLHESLKHLGTDTIDLYFLHRDDPSIPVVEILSCLERARKAGKIRYYGCSNWTLARIQEAQKVAEQEGFQGFTCNQLMWSLADIHFDGLTDKTFVLMDKPTYEYHAETGLNVMAYMSVAKGYFMRRSAGEDLPASVRDVYDNPGNEKIFKHMTEYKNDPLVTPLNLSLSYLMFHPFPSVPIASFDDKKQLEDAMWCCAHPIDISILKTFGAMKDFVC